MPSGSSERPLTVYGAIAANAVIAASKFAVGTMTGSSAMLSEAIHSDELHPFGYGKELYFWSLIVTILLFGMGGGMSIYEGITHHRVHSGCHGGLFDL